MLTLATVGDDTDTVMPRLAPLLEEEQTPDRRFVLTGGFLLVLESGQLGRWSIGVLESSSVAVMRLV